ncbi:hypothetical protein ACFD7R_004616 [Vibrio parahaemolyticus]
MSNKQKKIERFQFDKFVELLGLQYTSLEERESPDFICTLGSHRIGIELTEIKHPKKAEISGIQRSVVAKAQELCAHLDPLQVRVTFSHPVSYKGRIKNEISKYIADVVVGSIECARALNGSVYSVPLSDMSNQYGILGVYVNYGVCNNTTWLKAHRWSCIESGFVSSSFDQQLEKCIDSKNLKLKEYHKKCDECWLLIVADCSKKDQMFRLERQPKLNKNADFERVFFMEISQGCINEITVTKAT